MRNEAQEVNEILHRFDLADLGRFECATCGLVITKLEWYLS